MQLLIFIFLPLLAGLIITLVPREKIKHLSLVVQAYLLVQAVVNAAGVCRSGTPLRFRFTDSGLLGIGLELNPLNALFVILTAFLFLVFGLYILRDTALDRVFHFLFLVIEGAIILIFMSRDLFNIFVLIEVSTIICGILIMYLRDKRAVYDGLVYIIINTVGIMFYLLGVGMIYKMFGLLDIDALAAQISAVEPGQLVMPFAFIMTGLSVKAAIFPAYLWLPKAHGTPGAPSVVSAMLSGIYIKSAVFVAIQMIYLFREALPITGLLTVLGVITALTGIVLALVSKDMKLILAYHTISQIGLIIIGAVSLTPSAAGGGVLHMMFHALFKSLLFMTVGLVLREYDTRNVTEVRGLAKASPILAIALLAGILGITGAPFFNGSVSKYLIASGYKQGVMRVMLELINLGTTLSFLKLAAMLPGEATRTVRIRFSESVALMAGAASVLLTGIFGTRIQGLFGTFYAMGWPSVLEKGLFWLGYVVIAILLTRYVLPRIKAYREGAQLDLSFNTMVFSVLLAGIVYYGYLKLI